MTKYNRDSKGRFTTKVKAVKPKVVKPKVDKPKVKPKVVKEPTKRIYYRDSSGKFTSKAKAVKVQVVEPKPITKAPLPKKVKSEYGVIEIIVPEKDGITSRWIKYQDRASYNRQLRKIKEKYGFKKAIFHGVRSYNEFTLQTFKEQVLREHGLEI